MQLAHGKIGSKIKKPFLNRPSPFLECGPIDFFFHSGKQIKEGYSLVEFVNKRGILNFVVKIRPKEIFNGQKPEIEIFKDMRFAAVASLIKAAHLTSCDLWLHLRSLRGRAFCWKSHTRRLALKRKAMNKNKKDFLISFLNRQKKELEDRAKRIETYATHLTYPSEELTLAKSLREQADSYKKLIEKTKKLHVD